MSYESNVPTNTFSTLNNIRNFEIIKLVMFETGQYNSQYRRAYTAQLTAENQTLIEERVAHAGKIEASTLAGVGLKFVSPSAEAEKEVGIQNGWGERRIRFMMEVSFERSLGQKHIEILTGYTDEVGVSYGQHVNPQMVFYINSVIHLRKNVYNTPMGPQESVIVTQNSHLLGDTAYRGVAYGREMYMRPQDVFAEMGNLNYDKSGGLIDSRTAVSGRAVMSNRGHANPNQYLGRLMENYFNAAKNTDANYPLNPPLNSHEVPGGVYDAARSYSVDASASTDTVLKQIANVAQTDGVKTYFRYADLCALDPTIDQRKFLNVADNVQKRAQLHQSGQSEYWHAPTTMTLAATILSQVIPAIMSDNALTRIAFISHNNTIGAQPVVIVANALGFTTMDLAPSIENFRVRFLTEIIRDITYNNELAYSVEVDADLLGEISIILSLGDEPVTQYVVPTFADSLMVPVVTGNQAQAAHLAKQVDDLVGHLSDIGPVASPSTSSQLFDRY